MRLLAVVMTISLLFCSFACDTKDDGDDPTDWHYQRELKPYDPVKAGAAIEKSFDLTDELTFPNKSIFLPGFSDAKITTFYDLAIYQGNIYIHIDGKIFVFDKENFNKKREIIINFPDPGYSIFEYVDLINQGIVFYDPRHLGFSGMGFIVIENHALLLCHNEKQPPYPCYLFYIDIETGNAELWDAESILNIQGINMRNKALMGYNYTDDQFWIKTDKIIIEETIKQIIEFHFFKYNKDTHTFASICETPWAARNNDIPSTWWANINDNEVWYNGYNGPNPNGSIWNIVIDKRALDDPENSLHLIDVEYLGTLSIPISILYDPPYIWMLAEKDNKVLMLKLLPNDKD